MAAARPVIVETVETIQVVPPPPPPPPVVEAVVEAPAPPPSPDVEDDYLSCKEYEGRTISDKANSVTMFKHDNGQFYFAIYNENGSVRLRSEGFRTSQDRDKELSGALKNLNNADMYTTVRRGEYYMSILKDKTGREVGRSCLQKDEPTPVVAPVVVEETPVVAPIVAAAAIAAVAAAIPEIKIPEITVPEVKIPEFKVAAPAYVAPEIVEEVAEGGFKWWWLLLPLLALLAWWMFGKGCDKAAPTPTPAAVPIEAPKAAEPAATPAAAVPAAPSCDLNWILFDFDKADITAAAKAELAQMAKILKENKDYIGVLSAHTDGRGTDAYNDDLSLRRAAAAKRTLVAMGIEAGRLKTKADGKGAPVAQNTQDDAGRQFNRRVELYIQDKDGKDICQSIAPNIPDALKTK
jgi:OmpA-OmpF porin, OOP family